MALFQTHIIMNGQQVPVEIELPFTIDANGIHFDTGVSATTFTLDNGTHQTAITHNPEGNSTVIMPRLAVPRTLAVGFDNAGVLIADESGILPSDHLVKQSETGNVSVAGDLQVAGKITGDTQVQAGELYVTQSATVEGNASVSGDLHVNGSLNTN